MKTKKLIFVLSIFISLQLLSQTSMYVLPNKDKVKQLFTGGSPVTGLASDIERLTGNIVTCGFMNTVSSGKDAALVKLDSNLNQIWFVQFDSLALDDRYNDVYINPTNGDIYVTGYVTVASGNKNIVTAKYNASGTLQWRVYTAGNANLDDEGNSIAFDGTNVWVTGYVSITGKGKDAPILKFSGSTGALLAQPKRNGTSNGDDIGYKVCVSGTSAFVVGFTTNTGTNKDIFVGCVNLSTAALTWSIAPNGSANGDDVGLDAAYSLGDLYICGYKNNTTTGNDYYFARINVANGNIKTDDDYDGGYNGSDQATSLVPNKYYLFGVTGFVTDGSSNNYYHTRMYDTSSNAAWTHTISINGSYTQVKPKIAIDTIAYCYYVSGVYFNSTMDGLLYQVDNGGMQRWKKTHDGVGFARDAHTGLVVDGLARIFLNSANETGTATNTYDYDVIRYSQTPAYFPVNYNMAADTFNFNHLYYTNYGQIKDSSGTSVPDVLYYTELSQFAEYIQKNKVSFCAYKLDTAQVSPSDSVSRVDMYFSGANEFSEVYPLYFQETAKMNYFLDLDSTGTGITDVKGAANLIVPNIYPMIDLHYSSNAKGAKYSFVVKPTGNPSDISLYFDGAVSTATISGTLRVNMGFGTSMVFKKPDIYNVSVPSWTNLTISTTTVTGTNGWEDLGGNTYRINPGTYDASKPLVIEFDLGKSSAAAASSIANLDYSTYVGGTTSDDIFRDIAVGSNGARFAIGNASTGDFPASVGTIMYKGDLDVVVLSYTPGDTLVFATFFGGASRDVGNTIAVNSSNEIFIGGQTASMNFPVTGFAGQSNQTTNGYTSTLGIYEDGFLTKLNSTGNGYFWSRYYGGSRKDEINSIHVDASGNLHFAGEAFSTDIVMVNAAQSSVNTWMTTQNSEAIIGKFNSSLQIVYNTYFGNTNSALSVTREVGKDITTDNNGKALVVGWTDCFNLPVGNTTGNTNTFYDGSLGGYRDGFIARYSTTGAKEFASYFGGNGVDELSRVTFNSVKNEIYIGGTCGDTTNYPYLTLAGAFNKRKKVTNGVAAIASMDNTLTKQWCSNWGNAQTYSVTGLSTDNSGLVYLSGYTNDPTLDKPTSWPTGTVYKDTVLNGSYDGFVAVFAPVKSLYHAHYFGGAADDKIHSSDISLSAKLYVVGQTTSSDLPIVYNSTNINYIDSTYNGASDGFISRFVLSDLQIISVHELSFNNIGVLIYPNPTDNNFNIEIDKLPLQKTQISVFNMMGQLIDKRPVTEKTTRINCESWANGVYLINISDGSNSKTVKLIKN